MFMSSCEAARHPPTPLKGGDTCAAFGIAAERSVAKSPLEGGRGVNTTQEPI